jgi:7-cyano-7-deazaguanine synthase
MQNKALEGLSSIKLITPFLNMDKAGIVRLGAHHNVPFETSWSCYKGGALHCGRCGTCVERREAFDLARISDPTPYMDHDFWIKAVADKTPAERRSA